MKISRKEVIMSNLSTIRGFVPAILAGDSIDILDNRVGDRVTVSPNADDGLSGDEITIVFKVNAVMAVSKGAAIDDLANLISTLSQGAFGALGTGMGSGGAAGGGMAAGAVAGIAGATLDTLSDIMNSPSSSGTVHFQAEMKEIGGDPSSPVGVSVTTTVSGHTGTNDFDSNEQAVISNKAKLLTASGSKVKTENIGLSAIKDIDSSNSEATTSVSSDTALGQMEMNWHLETDGAVTHDTISLIQIGVVTMVCRAGV